MNSLIFSFFVMIVFLFHIFMRSNIRKGKVREAFCALWCVDAVFAVCGTVVSFILFRYTFSPYLNLRNILLGGVYLIITVLFFLLAPSGISLFRKKRTSSEEEILLAEYRFNDTLSLVRNYFLMLLFVLPILFTILMQHKELFSFLSSWKEDEIYGGFCFTAFLILLPVSLRQTLFWLRNLTYAPTEAEKRQLQKYSIHLYYRQKNWII